MLNAATLPPQRGSVITGREFAQKIRTVNYLPDSIIVALWIWPIHPARVTDHHPLMLLIRTRTDVGVPRRLTLSRGDRLAAQPNTQPNPADPTTAPATSHQMKCSARPTSSRVPTNWARTRPIPGTLRLESEGSGVNVLVKCG